MESEELKLGMVVADVDQNGTLSGLETCPEFLYVSER